MFAPFSLAPKEELGRDEMHVALRLSDVPALAKSTRGYYYQ
jgi:hypothetical protein